ncbi:MAG: hypothetical protein ACXAEU_17105 [Candidatus Hodarchaeales archaeon]
MIFAGETGEAGLGARAFPLPVGTGIALIEGAENPAIFFISSINPEKVTAPNMLQS